MVSDLTIFDQELEIAERSEAKSAKRSSASKSFNFSIFDAKLRLAL